MKHIFIGIDGTWRAAFQDRFYTNVYRLNMSLSYRDKKDNPQLFIYGAGVGAGALPLRLIGGAFGEGLDEVILGSYINLVSNYEPGDKIYLFGFSRGAFTARSVGGILSTLGLLNKTAMRYFYEIFEDFEHAGLKGYTPKLSQSLEEFEIQAPSSSTNEYLKEYKEQLVKASCEIPLNASPWMLTSTARIGPRS